MEKISIVLIKFKFRNYSLRLKVGRCLLSIIRMRKDLLLNYRNAIFNFYSENLSIESYTISSIIAAEFFLYLLEEEKGEFMKNQEIFREYNLRVRA